MKSKKVKRLLKKIIVFLLIVASLFIFTIPLNLVVLIMSMDYVETNKYYLITTIISLVLILSRII